MILIDITCGKCNSRIASIKAVKSLKEVMSQHGGKCPFCGYVLSTSEFDLDVQER